jgi:8-oxo-dGTP diphosphatase
MSNAPGSHTRARVAAGAIFFDDADRIMLVRPTYKEHWEIPGGYVEEGESPRDACRREITEELGLVVDLGMLLVVDWAPRPEEGDKLLFVFDGGHLDSGAVESIRLQDDELADHGFYPVDDRFGDLLIPRLERRLRVAVRARSEGRTLYLENGTQVQDSGHGYGHELPATGAVGVHRSPSR